MKKKATDLMTYFGLGAFIMWFLSIWVRGYRIELFLTGCMFMFISFIYKTIKDENALTTQRTELLDDLKMKKKRRSMHTGHSIDEYYCIQCGTGVNTHPDEILGFNQAVDELNNKLATLRDEI